MCASAEEVKKKKRDGRMLGPSGEGVPGCREVVAHNLICLIAPYFPKMSYISSAVMLKGRFLRGG